MPIFGYADEIIVFLFIGAALIKVFFLEKRETRVIDGWMITTFVLCSVLAIVAFMPNVFVSSHNIFWMQVYTFFGTIKFLLLFYSGRILLQDVSMVRTIPWMKVVAWSFTIVGMTSYVVNLVFPIMEKFDVRFGIATYSYGFGHPAPFSMVVILLAAMMVFFSFFEQKRLPYVYLMLNMLLILTAGRSTAIGIYLCFFLLLWILPYIKRPPIVAFMVLGAFLVWFSWDRIMNQFGADNTEARGLLLRTSVEIAKEHSPFGAGLGMFGSHASRLVYSPLYNDYHLSHVWGLTAFNPAFITDSYWAMIIGETGFLGAILLLLLFLVTMLLILRLTNGDFKLKLLVIFPFVYALFTSPVDTLLASGSVVSVMLLVLYLMMLTNDVTMRNYIGGKHYVQSG
ncbi:hypothetical protein HB943_04130 [Listeria weihenstephanensis]|uniref:O-antigen polymerase n=1 Tax=Listeria weihenstephanensis TaxID=1006155 RepID=A0A841Z1Q8_9LIST|nr:O-antigen ligase family protein [Listeria weihenstephanensis]MBC1499781.1 hypothetical protein [Listeria weihenstephanensis]